MEHVLSARSLFGTTMGFHIIFATLGVGLPIMMLAAEIIYQRTKDPHYAIMAKRWTKAFAVLLGVGIPTGTIASVQLSLLWPGFMEAIGEVLALPFQLEIYAFFLEAIFMAIYVYGADRISAKLRILSLSLVSLGALMSAVLITNVHAWQETPTGFEFVNGQFTNVNPWVAFFNPLFPVTAFHVATSASLTGAFVIASIAGYKLLKKQRSIEEIALHKKAVIVALVVGGIAALLTGLNGHSSAIGIYKYQPEKLAAAEGLFETTANAPLSIGGYVDPETQTLKGAIQIPGFLSILSTGSTSGVIRGLNDFPVEEWPPLYIHILFNAMVGVGTLLIGISFAGIAWKYLRKGKEYPKWLLWTFVLSGPMAIAGIELGWVFSEIGRQPWTIYRIMRTDEAVTLTGNMGLFFLLFIGLYLLLGITVVAVLRYYFKRHPLIHDLGKIGK